MSNWWPNTYYDSPLELPIFTIIMDDFKSLLEGPNYGEKQFVRVANWDFWFDQNTSEVHPMIREQPLSINQPLNKPHVRVLVMILVLDIGVTSVVTRGIAQLNAESQRIVRERTFWLKNPKMNMSMMN